VPFDFSSSSCSKCARWNGVINKVADTGRAEGSTASVAWLDRRAALPRDTLLKQRATLKFSEDLRGTRDALRSHFPFLARYRPRRRPRRPFYFRADVPNDCDPTNYS